MIPHTRKALLMVLLLLLAAQSITAQSRTEEAKKRLEGESDDIGVSALITFLEIGAEFMPEFFYFRAIRPDEVPLRYNAIPYYGRGRYNAGIRNFSGLEDDGKASLVQLRLNTSMPQGSLAMEQFSGELKWHIRYWAVHSRYEQLREATAPYPIRQFNVAAGRKFRFLENGDGVLYLGFRTLGLGADHYTGPELMTDFSWYFREPFSAHYTYSSMVQTYGFINNHEFGLQLHRQNMSFGLSYRWLDILGVHFRTLSFGAGINF